MQRIKSGLTTVLIVVAIVVIFQNVGSVETQILFWSFQLPRFVLLLATAAAGALAGYALALRRFRRGKTAK